jgi:hypothetical protein
VQYFTVQSKRPTMQVWHVPERVGVLLDRHDVMQASLCPMQLVPQLVACDLAVPFMASVQSEQLSHSPPEVHRYSVLEVTAGRAGLHMRPAVSPGPPSPRAPEPPPEPLLDPLPPLVEPLLLPELVPELVPELEPLMVPEPVPALEPLLLPELELLLPLDPRLELPPSSPDDWY